MKKNRCMIRKIVLAVLVLSGIFSLNIMAASLVKDAEYEGKGKVEVSFTSRVVYGKLKVKVSDSKGRSTKIQILKKEGDDLEFRIEKYREGKTYRFVIKGIKKAGSAKPVTVKGKIYIPKTNKKIPVKEIGYDLKDGELEFEFSCPVEWENPIVTVSHGKKSTVLSVKKTERKELEVDADLKKGTVYTYTISGIRKKGTEVYLTITGTFQA